jgi:hAT family C-terminal dimerisation region
MSQVARDYLHIPAGEVDVERLFSARRDLIGLRRYRLLPDTMRTLMSLRSSIQSSEKGL